MSLPRLRRFDTQPHTELISGFDNEGDLSASLDEQGLLLKSSTSDLDVEDVNQTGNQIASPAVDTITFTITLSRTKLRFVCVSTLVLVLLILSAIAVAYYFGDGPAPQPPVPPLPRAEKATAVTCTAYDDVIGTTDGNATASASRPSDRLETGLNTKYVEMYEEMDMIYSEAGQYEDCVAKSSIAKCVLWATQLEAAKFAYQQQLRAFVDRRDHTIVEKNLTWWFNPLSEQDKSNRGVCSRDRDCALSPSKCPNGHRAEVGADGELHCIVDIESLLELSASSFVDPDYRLDLEADRMDMEALRTGVHAATLYVHYSTSTFMPFLHNWMEGVLTNNPCVYSRVLVVCQDHHCSEAMVEWNEAHARDRRLSACHFKYPIVIPCYFSDFMQLTTENEGTEDIGDSRNNAFGTRNYKLMTWSKVVESRNLLRLGFSHLVMDDDIVMYHDVLPYLDSTSRYITRADLRYPHQRRSGSRYQNIHNICSSAALAFEIDSEMDRWAERESAYLNHGLPTLFTACDPGNYFANGGMLYLRPDHLPYLEAWASVRDIPAQHDQELFRRLFTMPIHDMTLIRMFKQIDFAIELGLTDYMERISAEQYNYFFETVKYHMKYPLVDRPRTESFWEARWTRRGLAMFRCLDPAVFAQHCMIGRYKRDATPLLREPENRHQNLITFHYTCLRNAKDKSEAMIQDFAWLTRDDVEKFARLNSKN